MVMNPFVKVCESKVLRRGIVVCCGPKISVRKLFLDPETFPGFSFSKRFLANQWKVVETAWDDACGAPGGMSGFTTVRGGDVFVVLPKWDSRVFVHEAYHAAQAILRLVGSQDEELGAYLVGWLFEEIGWRDGGKKGGNDEKGSHTITCKGAGPRNRSACRVRLGALGGRGAARPR
jgi:hypothetical protein